jgi:hypothetical protein
MLNRASGRRCVCAEIRVAFLNAFIEILKSEKFRLHLFSCICGTASLFVYCLIIFLIGHKKIRAKYLDINGIYGCFVLSCLKKLRGLQFNLTAAWLCGPALHLAALHSIEQQYSICWSAFVTGCGKWRMWTGGHKVTCRFSVCFYALRSENASKHLPRWSRFTTSHAYLCPRRRYQHWLFSISCFKPRDNCVLIFNLCCFLFFSSTLSTLHS